MSTIRLTMAQDLLRFLDAQYVELAGTDPKFVIGVLGLFGHGLLNGLGEALEYGDSIIRFFQGNTDLRIVHAASALHE